MRFAPRAAPRPASRRRSRPSFRTCLVGARRRARNAGATALLALGLAAASGLATAQSKARVLTPTEGESCLLVSLEGDRSEVVCRGVGGLNFVIEYGDARDWGMEIVGFEAGGAYIDFAPVGRGFFNLGEGDIEWWTRDGEPIGLIVAIRSSVEILDAEALEYDRSTTLLVARIDRASPDKTCVVAAIPPDETAGEGVSPAMFAEAREAARTTDEAPCLPGYRRTRR